MQAIDWNELISVSRSYIQTRNEFESLTKQKQQLDSDLPCMESIFSLFTDKNFQRIFNSYMFYPVVDIVGGSYTKLAQDIEKAKNDLSTCTKDLKNAAEHEDRKRNYIQLILSDIMDNAHKEQCCPLYCPEKVITSENLSVLKFIVSFAREVAPKMYNGEGGFAYGDSVIGNLSQRVDELEKKLEA